MIRKVCAGDEVCGGLQVILCGVCGLYPLLHKKYASKHIHIGYGNVAFFYVECVKKGVDMQNLYCKIIIDHFLNFGSTY